MIDGIAGTIFTTGDNVYPDGTPAEFATCYDTSWGGAIKARTRPAPGNHDWNTGNLNGYNGYFGANATDANGKSYYSFDIGSAWHVAVLDSECAMVVGGCVATSPQVDWLRADLAANASRNVIVVFHKPRFSSAVTNLAAMQPFWDVSYQYGVDIILVGHDHVYERFAPMAPNGTADPTFGVRQFTVGTGGAAAQSFGTALPTSQVRSPSQTYGVMKLTLHATTYDWLFLPIAGTTFTDSGTGSVHAAPNGEPTFDQNLPNRTDAEGAIIDLDAGATDPNGDPLTYEAANLPTGLSINASTGRITGTIAFTANASSPYAVSITVRDGASVDATDSFTWTVTNTTQPPTANATNATTNEEAPVAVALSGSDPDTCELTFSIVTAPTKGTLGSIGAATCVAGAPNTDSASVTYTPSLNATGSDSFTYRVFDGATNSAPVTASLTINAVEDLPTATGATGSTTTNEDTQLGLTVRGTDPETCNLTFNLPSTTTQGGTLGSSSAVACVAGNPNADTATLTYTPAANYNGPDSFSYTVTDGAAGTSLSVTVNLTVTSVNDLPTATGASGPTTTAEDTPLGLTLGGTDPETCNLTFNVPASTTHGTLSAPSAIACTAGSPNSDTTGVTYTPAAHYFGPDSFSYTVTDGATGTSSPVTVSLTVTAVNDPPAANAGTASTTTGSPVVISLAGSDRETCELTFSTPATHGPGRDPRGDQPAGLRGGQPQHRHGQPDLHPAGRLQRARQLHLHGRRRDRPLGRRDHLDHGRAGRREHDHDLPGDRRWAGLLEPADDQLRDPRLDAHPGGHGRLEQPHLPELRALHHQRPERAGQRRQAAPVGDRRQRRPAAGPRGQPRHLARDGPRQPDLQQRAHDRPAGHARWAARPRRPPGRGSRSTWPTAPSAATARSASSSAAPAPTASSSTPARPPPTGPSWWSPTVQADRPTRSRPRPAPAARPRPPRTRRSG